MSQAVSAGSDVVVASASIPNANAVAANPVTPNAVVTSPANAAASAPALPPIGQPPLSLTQAIASQTAASAPAAANTFSTSLTEVAATSAPATPNSVTPISPIVTSASSPVSALTTPATSASVIPVTSPTTTPATTDPTDPTTSPGDPSTSTVTNINFVSASGTSSAANGTATSLDALHNGAPTSFFQNKAAVAGVFSAIGGLTLILLILLIMRCVRRSRSRKFDREMDAVSWVPDSARKLAEEDDAKSSAGLSVGRSYSPYGAGGGRPVSPYGAGDGASAFATQRPLSPPMGAYGSFGYGHPPAPAQQQQGYPSPQPQGYPQMQYTPPSARLGPTAPPVAYMAERGGGATRAPFVPAQAQRAQVYYPQESAYSPSSANTASPSQGAPRGNYLSHYTSPSPRPAEAQGGGGGELSPTTTNIPLTPTPFPNPFDSAAGAGDANGGGEEHRVLKVANYTSPPASAYSGGLGVQGAREGEGEQDIPLTPSPFPNPFDSGR